MFSKLKYTKTNFHASLKADQMESLLHILQQGPELENYGGMISSLTKNYYIYQFQHAQNQLNSLFHSSDTGDYSLMT